MKEKILKLLKENKTEYLSGEYLSTVFGVSRTAVWKVIKQLQEEGYIIQSKTKLGYKLVESPDNLYSYEIQEGLRTKRIGKNIYYFEEIDSTNDYGKIVAQKPFEDGDIIIAESQNKGRGRFSREWVSPMRKGAYLSILLKPQISFEKITRLTIITALAVCSALEDHIQKKVEIKWPNDILINQKKICGILTEISGEVDKINYVVIGIGININLDIEDFDESLATKASSLKIETGKIQNRKEIVQKILSIFDEYYDDFLNDENYESIIDEYRKKSYLIGRNVEVRIYNNDSIRARVLDIEKNGALKVELENGEIRDLLSGEVTLSTSF